jgi:UDP-2,4-diacetamido-2,4,6-trideoxy-beta-L-altropyranose hydrolase
MVNRTDRLLIRADASASMGAGHVMRCLALAQAWKDVGGITEFACAELPETLRDRLVEEGCNVHLIAAAPGGTDDFIETSRLAEFRRPSWIVIDGYQFHASFYEALCDPYWQVLVIDDDARHDAYRVQMLLNQNIGASASWYQGRAPGCRLLLGCRYAMLRREFRNAGDRPKIQPERVSRILVTLGGADPACLTQPVVEACLRSAPAGCRVDVVIGPANPNRPALEEFASRAGDRVALHVVPCDLPRLMADCDLAICAAGSSVYELGHLGVPMIVLVTADNQRMVAEHLEQIGAALRVAAGPLRSERELDRAIEKLAQDSALRAAYAAKLRALIDGQGAARVVKALTDNA